MVKGRSIWFVRHAQSEYNKKKLFTGWHDPDLTDAGLEKAFELKSEYDNIKFDFIYSSPLKRALRTAERMSNGTEFIVDERLKERSYGDWSGQSKDLIRGEVGEEEFFLARRGWSTSPPNGESLQDVKNRVKSFLDDLPKNGNILVVSHGNTIRAISVALGKNTEEKNRVKKKVIIISAIDNLIKGASGQAVQNMNISKNFNENLGLK